MKALCWNHSDYQLTEDFSGKKTWNPDDAMVRFMLSSMQDLDLQTFTREVSRKHAGYFSGHERDRDESGTESAVHNVAQQNCAKVGSIIGCGVCSYCKAEHCPHHDSSETIITENTHRFIARGIFG